MPRLQEAIAFWRWALDTKTMLERRVAEARARRDTSEAAWRDRLGAEGKSAAEIDEFVDGLRSNWNESDGFGLESSEAELERFLIGPLGMSHRGKPLCQGGLSSAFDPTKSARFYRAWQGRYVNQNLSGVVQSVERYFRAAENVDDAESARSGAVLAVRDLLSQFEPGEAGATLYTRAESLLEEFRAARVPKRARDWGLPTLRAVDLACAITGWQRERVLKIYKAFRGRTEQF